MLTCRVKNRGKIKKEAFGHYVIPGMDKSELKLITLKKFQILLENSNQIIIF